MSVREIACLLEVTCQVEGSQGRGFMVAGPGDEVPQRRLLAGVEVLAHGSTGRPENAVEISGQPCGWIGIIAVKRYQGVEETCCLHER